MVNNPDYIQNFSSSSSCISATLYSSTSIYETEPVFYKLKTQSGNILHRRLYIRV